ncbi:MAG TPA: hypothetical protein VFW86_06270 [Candidatus Limnocylindrales bacterium]|nr:hypothetical protein [Candidatus Limnocylindrales bacterium]
MGDLTDRVANGVGGLIGGAVAALGDAVQAMVHAGQAALPGPLFPVVVGGLFLALVLWTIRK